jgi:hypothetical protein
VNPYLLKLRGFIRENPHPCGPSKPSKLGFKGFEGDQSSRSSDGNELVAFEQLNHGRTLLALNWRVNGNAPSWSKLTAGSRPSATPKLPCPVGRRGCRQREPKKARKARSHCLDEVSDEGRPAHRDTPSTSSWSALAPRTPPAPRRLASRDARRRRRGLSRL